MNNQEKLKDILMNKKDGEIYLGRLYAGADAVEYVSTEIPQAYLHNMSYEEAYIDVVGYILQNCLTLYKLNERGMDIVWEKEYGYSKQMTLV